MNAVHHDALSKGYKYIMCPVEYTDVILKDLREEEDCIVAIVKKGLDIFKVPSNLDYVSKNMVISIVNQHEYIYCFPVCIASAREQG